MLIKHGSYAKAYLDEVKGQGVILDRKPFYLQPGQHYRPPAKPEEILTLEELVKLREKLSIQLNQLLRRLIQLKKAQVSHHGDKQRNGGEKVECGSEMSPMRKNPNSSGGSGKTDSPGISQRHN